MKDILSDTPFSIEINVDCGAHSISCQAISGSVGAYADSGAVEVLPGHRLSILTTGIKRKRIAVIRRNRLFER